MEDAPVVSTLTAEGSLEGLNRKSFALTESVQTINRSILVEGCTFGLTHSTIRLFNRTLEKSS